MRGNQLPRLMTMLVGLVVMGMAVVAVWGQLSGQRRAPLTFDPPYPEVDAGGAPILAVFEGRIPCFVAHCEKRKVSLVLYQDRATSAPSTYWLGLVGVGLGNTRDVTRGTWETRRGTADYPKAVVYELDARAPDDLHRFWRVSEDVLLPLDESMRPKPGNAAWGFMLSRYTAPYGPRTYQRG
jgi:hypothetical protein